MTKTKLKSMEEFIVREWYTRIINLGDIMVNERHAVGSVMLKGTPVSSRKSRHCRGTYPCI